MNNLTTNDFNTLIQALREAQFHRQDCANHLEKLATQGGTGLVTQEAAEQVARSHRDKVQEYYDLRDKLEAILHS